MKCWKNGIIFTIVFVLLTGMVYAASDEQTTVVSTELKQLDASFETAQAFLTDLTGQPIVFASQTVQRGEFVRAAITAAAPDAYLGGSCPFSDVDSADANAPYITYAVHMGIVSSGELFYPEQEITYLQAFKILLILTGYDVSAQSFGGYPDGYRRLAVSTGLASVCDGGFSDALSARDAVVLLYQTLHTEILKPVNSSKGLTYRTAKEVTLLSDVYGLTKYRGIVTADAHSSLTDAQKHVRTGYICIDNEEVRCENADDLLGLTATVYYKEENNEKQIMLLYPEDTNNVTLRGRDILAIENRCIKVDVGGKTRTYRLQNGFYYIYNGKARSMLETDLLPYFAGDDMKIALVDNNRDGVYETVLVKEYRYIYIDKVDSLSEKLYDVNSADNAIDLSDAECLYRFYNHTGEEMALRDVAAGALYAYLESTDKMWYRFYECADFASGTVTATVKDGEKELYIDDQPYEISRYFGSYYTNILPGRDYDFLLGWDGRLVVCEALENTEMQYGFVVGIDCKSTMRDAVIKIFTQKGKMELFTLTKDVIVDADTKLDSHALGEYFDNLSYRDRLLRFGLNADGKLHWLDFARDFSFGTDTLYRSDYNPYDSITRYYSGSNLHYKRSGSMGHKFMINGAVNFVVPPDGEYTGEEKYYSVVPMSYFIHDQVYTLSAYDITTGGTVGATLTISENAANKTVEVDDKSAVIEKITRGLDTEGNEAICVYLWSEGSYQKCFLDPEESYDVNPSELGAGDIIRFTLNLEQYISAFKRDFAFQTYQVNPDGNATGVRQLQYFYGIIYDLADTQATLMRDFPAVKDGSFDEGQLMSADKTFVVPYNNLVYVDIVRRKGGEVVQAIVKPASYLQAAGYKTAGKQADFMLIRNRWNDPYSISVVYHVEYID